MYFRLFLLLAIVFGGILVLPLPHRVNAATPLTRAEIQYLKNLVQLIRKNNPALLRAQKSDSLTPGDGLSTGRDSLADLRFNDGSLARVGEQALFQFIPETRDFSLSNGTMLLLIPPGNGQTRVRTPNAAAAIRGSALFVRYNQETDTTIIGALTNSGIEVSNKEASQNQVLQAGQLMVVVKGQFQGLYDFDLRTFYETSSLVRGLDLTKRSPQSDQSNGIANVKTEIATAISAQSPVVGQGVLTNPPFVQNSHGQTNSSNQTMTTGVVSPNSPKTSLANSLTIKSSVEPGGLVQSAQAAAATKPPATKPSTIQLPPATQIPPTTQPPTTQIPPATQPPTTQPPTSNILKTLL